tara:strand:- start:523 stop:1848 length:1326 start_codon:yes stop_codon:yes gene_type:complete
MIETNKIADYCLRDFSELKAKVSQRYLTSEFDVDYELRLVLFVSGHMNLGHGDVERSFIKAVATALGWSSMYESLLQNRIDKQPAYQLEDYRIGGKEQDFAILLYRLAYCMSRIDGEIVEDEQSFLGNLSGYLFSSEGKSKELDEELESLFQNGFEKSVDRVQAEDEESEELSLDSCLAELDQLVGLEKVKDEIDKLISYLKIQAMRKEHDLAQANLSLHMVFTGSPGTGKTTVARIIAKIYRALGFLKKGHLVETDRSGLIGKYVGHTEAKTTDVINQALNGVLFIDEAYSLVKDSDNDFGQEAIDTIVKRMEDDRDCLVVIVAGYENEMQRFIGANPGLQSRFNTYVDFENYEPKELLEVLRIFAKANDYEIASDAEGKVMKVFETKTKEATSSFGNARFVRNLFEQILRNHAFRLSRIEGKIEKKDLMLIEARDVVVG